MIKTEEKYIKKIEKALQNFTNLENAAKQKKYMKNRFDFFGLKAPIRRKATRELMKKKQRPDYKAVRIIVRKLWQKPEREYQYFAIELLERYKKQFKKDIMELFESMITNKSWWDTVDIIAKKLVGEYFRLFPKQRGRYIEKWINSDNIWLQRTSLLFQLGYKKNTDSDLLFDIIEQLKTIDEFFIQKAIGWALREYSKVNPELVVSYMENHKLSTLSRKEGLKIINKLDKSQK